MIFYFIFPIFCYFLLIGARGRGGDVRVTDRCDIRKCGDSFGFRYIY